MSSARRDRAEQIMVTCATLPPLPEYLKLLEQIWSTRRLTNNGPLLRELEVQLAAYLPVKNIRVVNNCTSALMIALEAGGVTGEVITTPFSYVATSAAIVWQKCTPVFADIKPTDLTIDPDMVEQLIGPKTRAILATHVYGLPCEVDRLEEIARRHNLLLIYDAAHAFGCRYRGRPLASYGDISCLSFHATKVFHSVEGGAVVVNRPDSDLLKRVEYMRSFGHIADDFRWAGINAKCSELHAAMGLCNLPRVTETIAQRKEVCRRYDEVLANTAIRRIDFSNPELMHNGAYYPIVFPSEKTLLETMKRLNQVSVFPRRYFWPALNRLEFLGPRDCPCAESAADRVICLPVSPEVTPEIVELVGRHIRAVTG